MRNFTCVFLLSIMFTLVFVGCGNEKLSETAYIEKAKASMDGGNYRESVIHLKNALGHYPDSAEARYLLGDIYVRSGVGGGAEKELLRARELGVAEEAIVGKLGDALLMQGKADELLKQYSVNDSDSPQVKGAKWVARGDAYFQLRDVDNAKKMYELASDIPTAKLRAQMGVARTLLATRQVDDAVALIEKLSKEQDVGVLGWLTRADIYRGKNNSEEILASYKKAAELSKSPQDYYYYVAMKGQVEHLLQKNSTDKAESVLNTLKGSFYKETFPDTADMNHIRGVLAFQKKDYPQAKLFAEKVVKVLPNHYGSILVLGAVNALEGNYEQAESYLQNFLSAAPGHIAARKMLAFVQLNRNEAKAAVKTLKPFEKAKDIDADMLALVASASLRAGDAEAGAEFFQKALVKSPDSPQLRGGLAQSYVGMGEYDKALSELNQMREEKPESVSTRLAIVETYIKAKNYTAALKELADLEKQKPEEPLYISMQGTVYLMLKKQDQAKTLFEKAMKKQPGYPPAGRNLAILALSESKSERAEEIYREILSKNPGHIETMYDFAQLKVRGRNFAEAEKLVKKVKELDKNKERAAVLLARVYLQQQKAIQAIAELRAVESIGSGNSGVLAELGNAQMMIGEYDSALASYQKLSEVEKDSATAHYLVYTAYAALRNKDGAKTALNRSLGIDGGFIPALVAKVNMLFAEKKFTQAAQWVDKIETIDHESGYVPLLKAELAMYDKKPKQAIELYAGLYEKNFNPSIAQKLAQAYWFSGERGKALEVLNSAAEKQPDNSQLYYVLGTAYDGMDEKDKAINAYKKAVQLNEQHVLALNNLAWLIRDMDKTQALAYAQKALELAPKNRDIQDTVDQIRKR